MSIDTIGDFLTIIRNGRMVSKPSVVAPYSRVKHAIADILQSEGFIRGCEVIENASGRKVLKLSLNGEDVHGLNSFFFANVFFVRFFL